MLLRTDRMGQRPQVAKYNPYGVSKRVEEMLCEYGETPQSVKTTMATQSPRNVSRNFPDVPLKPMRVAGSDKVKIRSGDVLLPVLPANVIATPVETLGFDTSHPDIMAETLLSCMWCLNPPAPDELLDGSKIGPTRMKAMLMWAFCSKMREVGSLTCGIVNVYNLFPDYPSGAPVPVSWALLISHWLPYFENGVRFNKVFNIMTDYFTNLMSQTVVGGGLGVSKRCSHLNLELYTISGSEYAFTAGGFIDSPEIFTDWADAAQYMSGSVSCCSYSEIGTIAPDASAYATNYKYMAGCASANYNSEYVPLLVHYKAAEMTDVGLHNRPIHSPVVARGGISQSHMLDFTLRNYFTVLAEAEFKGTIHETLKTTRFPTLTTFSPNVRYLHPKQFWDVCFESQKRFCSTQEQAAAACTVWWTQLLCAMREAYSVSGAVDLVNNSMVVARPLHRPFSTLPTPPAVAEYISGLGPVLDEGRVCWICPPGYISASATTGHHWLRALVLGNVGYHNAEDTMWADSIQFPGETVISSLSFVAANFPGLTYILVPGLTARRFTDAYRLIVEIQSFVPVMTQPFGILDTICPLRGVEVEDDGETSNGLKKKMSFTLDYMWSPTILSSVDLNRVLGHCYQRTTAVATSLKYPRCSALAGNVDPTASLAHYLSTSGYNILAGEIPHIAADTKHGYTLGTYTVPTTVAKSGVLSAIRRVANDYNSSTIESGGMVEMTASAVAKEGRESAALYLWSPYIKGTGKGSLESKLSNYGKQTDYPKIMEVAVSTV